MTRIATVLMIILFWTGLADGPAGEAHGLEDPSQGEALIAQAEAQVVDRWLLEVAACEAGHSSKCAPVLY